MTGIQWFTIIMQTLIGLFAGPLLLMIGFGKIFGKTPPTWAVWGLIVLLIAYFVMWVRNLLRTIRTVQAIQAASGA